MKRFLRIEDAEDDSVNVVRLQNILISNGIEASLVECADLCNVVSRDWDAGWLNISESSDSYIFGRVIPFLPDDLRSEYD